MPGHFYKRRKRMVNLKDNSYQLTTKTGEKLTFKLDFEAVLRLEMLVGNSVGATRIFLDLFRPGTDEFYKKGLMILCACCVEKPNMSIKEFNELFPLTNETFSKIDEVLNDLVTGFFGTSDEDVAVKK